MTFSALMIACAGVLACAGCSGEKAGSAADKRVDSQVCIDCHDGLTASVSPVTGLDVTREFRQSAHYRAGKASCNDCHEKSSRHLDQDLCSACHGSTPHIPETASTPLNPVHASPGAPDHPALPAHTPKCFKCHFLPNPYKQKDIMTYQIRLKHLSSAKTIPGRANYLPADSKSAYADSCSRCHNPHNNSSGMNHVREWAASGKGDLAAGAWGAGATPSSGREFRLNGEAYNPNPQMTDQSSAYNQCVRCHTTTGYLNFIGQGGGQFPHGSIGPFGGPPLSQGKEALFCNACHLDYSFARRRTGPVTVFYNTSTNTAQVPPVKIRLNGISAPGVKTRFKDIGTSNLCLWCHTGRETGAVITLVSENPAVSFEKLPIILSHYLTGGASLLQNNGYEFSHLDPARTYPTLGRHQDVGMADYQGGAVRGPCISCHMPATRHTFEPLSTSRTSRTDFWQNSVQQLTPVCTGCHGTYSPADVNSRKIAHRAALAAVLGNLTTYRLTPGQQNNIRSFVKKGTTANFVQYSSNGGLASPKIRGRDLMGAAFNWVSLMNDYGSYVHNVPYAKKLMYDSIDLLDNGVLDFSTCDRLTKTHADAAYSYLCTNGTRGTFAERP
jgi:hypothetical protein